MITRNTNIKGVKLISFDKNIDDRGFFVELYKKELFIKLNILDTFIQENFSRSKKNVLRGLHYTINNPQSQIVTLLSGHIFDVLVDLRRDSTTFGKWEGFNIDANKNNYQLYMPHGVAHGFCVLSAYAELHYMVSEYYNKNDEFGIVWNDPTININWPLKNPIISERDKGHPKLLDINKNKLPQ
tara:strand:- start:378 stop:929 length:552 start_codon:yes stop_codon:yes gene_type:complete